MSIKDKSLYRNEPDRSSELNRFVADRTNRSDMAYLVKQSGIPADAPCFEMAYELTPDNTKYIYKVNCPGWLYVAYKDELFTSNGNVSVLLADSPSNLQNSGVLYMQGFSGDNKNANTMMPIHPGESTYMYLNVDVSNKTVFFIPAAVSVAMNIYQPSYAEKLYSVDWSSEEGNNTECGSIFAGDWKANFKSLAGVWVMDEGDTKVKWPSADGDEKTAFIAARKDWLNDLGIDPSEWGYT